MISAHSQTGQHFPGLRRGRRGDYEIVYDGGPSARRFVWRLKMTQVVTEKLGHRIHDAIRASDVLNTLYSGLRSEEIDFEVDYDHAGLDL